MVIYDPSTNEMLMDLGFFFTWDEVTPGYNLFYSERDYPLVEQGFGLEDFSAVSDWSQLNATFFSFLSSSSTFGSHMIFATTSKVEPNISKSQMSNFLSSANKMYLNCIDNPQCGIFVGQAAGDNAYHTQMNRGVFPGGFFAGFNRNAETGEVNLAPLAEGQSVTMYLYHNILLDGEFSLNRGPDQSTDYCAALRIDPDGSVILNPPVTNEPPEIKNATASPVSGPGGTAVTLSGTASDGDGDGLTYTWSTDDGLGGFPQASATASFTAPAYVDGGDNVYTFKLTVSDGTDTDTAAVTFTVTASQTNEPPEIKSATASPVSGPGGTAVTLSGTASDGDGDGLTYTWSTGDGLGGFPQASATASFTAPAYVDGGDNVYTFKLTVSDGTDTDTAAVTFTVTQGNTAPVILNATIDPDSGTEGTRVLISGEAIDVDVTDALTYAWSSARPLAGLPTDKQLWSFTAPAFINGGDNEYIITLTVSDGTDSVTQTFTFTVTSENTAPTISSATASPNPAAEGATVTLSGAASDGDGDALTYTWSTEEGVGGFPQTGATASFAAPAYVEGGDNDYTFTLTVSDGTDSAARDVTFTVSQNNTAPVISGITASPNPAVEGTTVTLSGTAGDADGDDLTYIWSTSDDIDDFPKTGVSVTFTAPAYADNGANDYTFTLTVGDGTDTVFRDVNVSVSQAATATPGIIPTVPFNGGTVNTQTPVIGVMVVSEDNKSSIQVEFEVYRDSAITGRVAVGQTTVGKTAWRVDEDLEDETTYYWRARIVNDDSWWTSVFSFTVDLDGSTEPEIMVVEEGIYDLTVPYNTIIKVTDAGSAINGTQVIIPAGALRTTTTISIGEATGLGIPTMDSDLVPVGKVIDFGPSGTWFNMPITINIPYTEAALKAAGGINPAFLMAYTYDKVDRRWETIAVKKVDEENNMLVCEIEHFSLYTIAATNESGRLSGQNNGSGDGGSSCFVGTVGSLPAGTSWIMGFVACLFVAMAVSAIKIIQHQAR